MISLDELPYVDGGVPGVWQLVTHENLNDGLSGALFVDGVSQGEISGHTLRRLVGCAGNMLRAARRLDAECVVGDATAFVPEPDAVPEPESVKAEAGVAAVESDAGPEPESVKAEAGVAAVESDAGHEHESARPARHESHRRRGR